MNLRNLRRNWDAFGQEDPYWAVLTVPERRGGHWTVEELLEHGRKEIDSLMRDLGDGLATGPRRLALDFGCGVGRLTQALARYYDHVVGIDIAPSMIEAARAIDTRGANCEFILNDRADLSVLNGRRFDLIYSNIVLQHVAPRYTRAYVGDFIRLLSAEGVAVFHLPGPVPWQRVKDRVPEAVLRPVRRLCGRRGPVMQMYGMDPHHVQWLVTSHQGEILGAEPSVEGGERFPGTRFVVRRRES